MPRVFEWSVTNIALDDDAQRLYATLTDIGGATRLKVFDALNLTPISVRYLPTHTYVNAMLVNPRTHHLFLAHGYYSSTTEADNTLEALDTRTMGRVSSMSVSPEPMVLADLGDRVYVASNSSTDLTVVRDCVVPAQPP